MYFLTGNINGSEDIVQESFIECFKSAKNLKDPNTFKPWFYKIVTRTAWRYISKEKKVTPIENIYEKADESSRDKSYYFNDLSIKEIAKVMGCFEGTVKSRLYAARKNLKNSLQYNENFLKEHTNGMKAEK